jgi:hypothetical protein
MQALQALNGSIARWSDFREAVDGFVHRLYGRRQAVCPHARWEQDYWRRYPDSRMMFYWSCLDCGHHRRAEGPPPAGAWFWHGRGVAPPVNRGAAPAREEESRTPAGSEGSVPEEEEELEERGDVV